MLPDYLKQVIGGEDEDRTHDLRIANAALSQLSYPPDEAAILYHTAAHLQQIVACRNRSAPAAL